MARFSYKHWPDGSQMSRKTILGRFTAGSVRHVDDDVSSYLYRTTHLDPIEAVPDQEGE